jgi:hypothetical protein
MIHDLPVEIAILIVVIVSVFGIAMVCLCCILGGASPQRSSRCSYCCCARSNRRRPSDATRIRQFDSLHELLSDIDGDETARVVLAVHHDDVQDESDGQENPTEAAVASSRETENHIVLDVSLDTFFPDLLQGPKDDMVRMPRNEVSDDDSRQRQLEEPLL